MSDITIPSNTEELYNMMCNTPDLCGSFKLIDDTIIWDLFDRIDIQIFVGKRDTYIGIVRKLFGKIPDSLTHWHQDY